MHIRLCLPTYVAGTIIALGGASCARAESEVWTNIRLVVYEDRKAGKLLGCSEQHIREHVYTRMIHKALDSDGSRPFIVDAQSTMDKIVISVNILARPSDHRSIASVLEDGLHSKPPSELLASEQRLVAIEDAAISARPGMADGFLWQLAPAVGSESLFDCGNHPPSKASIADFDWRVGRYQIAIFDRQELPEIRSDPREDGNGVAETRGIHNFSEGSGIGPDTPPQVSGDVLFVGLTGHHNAEDHILAVAQIRRAAREVPAPPPQIRPFGIGGFVLFGKPDILKQLSDRLAIDPGQDTVSPINEALVATENRQAHSYVCRVPSGRYSTVGAWADAVALHPYFSFWTRDTICKDKDGDSGLFEPLGATRSVKLYRQFLSSSPRKADLYKIGNIKYSFCYSSKEKDVDSRKIARETFLDALRQYFRMDVGLSLDIKEKDLSGDCSTIGFISPVEHHNDLRKEIESFTLRSEKFSRRLHAARMEYYCDRLASECRGMLMSREAASDIGSAIFTLKTI